MTNKKDDRRPFSESQEGVEKVVDRVDNRLTITPGGTGKKNHFFVFCYHCCCFFRWNLRVRVEGSERNKKGYRE